MMFTTQALSRTRPAWRYVAGAALLSLAHATAFAQSAPAPLVLACPTPASTGVSADLSTAAGSWEIQAPGSSTWATAGSITPHTAWHTVTGSSWIGNPSSGVTGNYSFRRQIDASDPNIDPASVRVSYSYLSDNRMDSANLGGPLTVSPVGFTGTPGSATNQTATLTPDANNYLTFVAYNSEGPFGITANVNLTFNCRDVTPVAVPVNAPWALAGLGGLLMLVAGLRRRRA